MAWKKGQSGNPAGRKPDDALVEIREAARAYGKEAVERLVHLMRLDDSPRVSIAACTALLDRGYGKPTADINICGEREPSLADIILRVNNEIHAESGAKNISDVTPRSFDPDKLAY